MRCIIKNISILIVALMATISYGQDKELPVPAEYPFGNPKDDSRGVFGDDDRYEVSDVSGIEDYTRATAVMIPKESVYGNSLYGVTLRDRLTYQFGTENMDKNVKYLDQPTIAGCSGFLVAPDIMVSAGHCILTDDDAKGFYWLFDYTTNLKSSEDGFFIEFDPDNLYEINEVLEGKLEGEGEYQKDYVVMRLDRKVKDRKPYRIRTSGKPANEASVYTIGAPTGLPLKVALNSEVVENTPEQWFKTDIDAFPGNSGGPVFDPNGFIEGILVRGAVEYANGSYTGDYKYDADCDCVKTVTFSNADYNAGCQIQKINEIPFNFLESIIYENLENSIRNNDPSEFERWAVYSWIFKEGYLGDGDSLETLIMAYDRSGQLLGGRAKILKALIKEHQGSYETGFENKLVDYVYDSGHSDLRSMAADYLNLDAVDQDGDSALMNIISHAFTDVDMIKELLEYGANPNLVNNNGKTPLLIATEGNMRKQQEIVELLLKNGAKPNQNTSGGDTALLNAVKNNKSAIAELLLVNDADATIIDGSGNSALHIAARSGNSALAKLLIKYGANAKLKNRDRRYPDKVAKKAGHKDLGKWLKKERKKK
ncbi:Ankyrin repeat [Nonlabens sp. Hel1_33_55]|uniref:ankyrin repeat domain-containing protein n=1 Tax=Nonlabens sp. Hel1_33_55 TaxID=1336802 RepID=UPI000875BA72|nr:ankyrin repeat domain-containing protein [Nonlabens sp. Hel1_33_55]SCX99481.1 Ankyrin repeat [Nonlabens sp. Hel1_33_55]